MFPKLIALTLLLVALAGGLLLLRQQRLETAHRTAAVHIDVQKMREAVWAEQVRSGRLLPPDELRRRIRRAGIELLPATGAGVVEMGDAGQTP